MPQKNVEQRSLPGVDFSQDNYLSSIVEIFKWIEAEANSSHEWYLAEKSQKARMSKLIRLLSVLLLTTGTISPVLSLVTSERYKSEYGYVFLGLGAGAVMLDRGFGFTSSWMRYMTSAATIGRFTKQYQLSWAAWNVGHPNPAREDCADVVASILKPFSDDVFRVIEAETSDWQIDFRENIKGLHSMLENGKANPGGGLA